ncbi:MAG: lectin-like protein [Chloroflexota bacterium]
MPEQTKKCPMCAEEIPVNAKVCPYCDTRLVSEPPLPTAPSHVPPRTVPSTGKPKRTGLVIGLSITAGLAVLCILAGIIWVVFQGGIAGLLPVATSTPTRTKTPHLTATATADPRISNQANNHKYLFVQIGSTWHQAQDYCMERGGHLVTIQDAEEDQFIFQLTGGNTWLGASDEAQEGTWVWVTREPWNYQNWDTGEPNNYQIENYLTYQGPASQDDEPAGDWNDDAGEKNFVCEWDE